MIKVTLQSIGMIIAVVFTLLLVGLIMDVAGALNNRTKMINCSIAEFSPDFTTEMKEACRKARMEQK